MKSTPPHPSLPKVICDFNACGWSGEPDDNCYYVFDEKALAEFQPCEGLRLFAFMDEGEGVVIGCEVVLERYKATWRGRPDESSWYSGPPGKAVAISPSAKAGARRVK